MCQAMTMFRLHTATFLSSATKGTPETWANEAIIPHVCPV